VGYVHVIRPPDRNKTMAMEKKSDYKIGEMLTLKHDKEKMSRMLVGISERPNGKTYCLAQGTTETWHYDIELERSESETKKINGFGK
jgi:phage protein U